MTKCPQCDYDAIWVKDLSLCIAFDGTQIFYPRKVVAFCNTTTCDQRYWWYPTTGRITKRNIGPYSPYLHRYTTKATEAST
ncbi:hypothetical protein LCGC14_0289480 [marine sediment metagenome]|uniref:Uncharacterized protein n=1 Tax=marine sediment metagenome TaxID=412755 RepID=A0A0F9WF26_9ZZZZ